MREETEYERKGKEERKRKDRMKRKRKDINGTENKGKETENEMLGLTK